MKEVLVAFALALGACTSQSAPAAATPEAAADLPAETSAGQPQTGLSQVPLTITSANGVHHFTVDVAATPAQQETGLMFVKSMPADKGMIFPYDPPQSVAFWMHNTLIPLDMVFIRADGTIARIATAKALDDTPVPSGEPIVAVLELNAGRAAELGIAPGDKVEWSH